MILTSIPNISVSVQQWSGKKCWKPNDIESRIALLVASMESSQGTFLAVFYVPLIILLQWMRIYVTRIRPLLKYPSNGEGHGGQSFDEKWPIASLNRVT